MQQAGPGARGGTAYVNLETGDCHGDDASVAALVQSGVGRCGSHEVPSPSQHAAPCGEVLSDIAHFVCHWLATMAPRVLPSMPASLCALFPSSSVPATVASRVSELLVVFVRDLRVCRAFAALCS